MSAGVLFALGALALVALALALVLPSLLRARAAAGGDLARRENIAAARERIGQLRAAQLADHAAAEYRQEIEAQLLDDTAGAPPRRAAAGRRDWLGAALVVAALAVLAPATYLLVGEPGALSDNPAAAAQSLTALTERLERRVAAQPDDADALAWLGRVLAAQGRHAAAADYYGRASALQPARPELLAAHINALILAGPGSGGELEPLLAGALQKHPADPAILWLAGLYADSRGDTAQALASWKQALELLDGDEQQRAQLLAVIADAEARLGR